MPCVECLKLEAEKLDAEKVKTDYCLNKWFVEEYFPRFKTHMKVCKENLPKKRYAFTFTTNLDTGAEIQKEMCESAAKLFDQKTVPISSGRVYLEYTKEGRPHLHGWYQTVDGGRVFAKVIRRCWRFWGEKDRAKHFPGGYHAEMVSDRYQQYAAGEGRLLLLKEDGDEVQYHPEVAENFEP